MATSAAARVDLRSLPLRAPSPFIKWVGGKGRLLAQLLPLLPPGVERMRHVEPFSGGAAMFFARRPERALLCDVNAALVETYRMVRDEVDAVIDALEPLAEDHGKEAYYRVRTRYNETRHGAHGPQRAAMFIYLNKTCFNGLHRVNKKGEMIPTASGIRSPGGIGLNHLGDVFYSDNQGPWNGSSSLKHLKAGSFQSHPASRGATKGS